LVNGNPIIQIKEIDMGLLPVPEVIMDEINEQIPNDGLEFSIPNLSLKNIEITDGAITATGNKN
jgi:hypothetical protein